MPRSLRFVDGLVFAPAPLETVLRAEETVDTHLQTCRALQRARIVLAAYPKALAGSDSRCHGG